MKVYGVYIGIDREGGQVLPDIYTSYRAATDRAKAEIKSREYDDLELSKFDRVDGKDEWSNGIDIVAIKKFTINDKTNN